MFLCQEKQVALFSVRDNQWTINTLQAIAASYKEASPLDLVKHKNNLTYFLSNNSTRIIQR